MDIPPCRPYRGPLTALILMVGLWASTRPAEAANCNVAIMKTPGMARLYIGGGPSYLGTELTPVFPNVYSLAPGTYRLNATAPGYTREELFFTVWVNCSTDLPAVVELQRNNFETYTAFEPITCGSTADFGTRAAAVLYDWNEDRADDVVVYRNDGTLQVCYNCRGTMMACQVLGFQSLQFANPLTVTVPGLPPLGNGIYRFFPIDFDVQIMADGHPLPEGLLLLPDGTVGFVSYSARNTSSPYLNGPISPQLTYPLLDNLGNPLDHNNPADLNLADLIGNDGLPDLMISDISGNLYVHRMIANYGGLQPYPVFQSTPVTLPNIGNRGTFGVDDLDRDGLTDLVVINLGANRLEARLNYLMDPSQPNYPGGLTWPILSFAGGTGAPFDFSPYETSATSGFPMHTVRSADLARSDNQRLRDLVIGTQDGWLFLLRANHLLGDVNDDQTTNGLDIFDINRNLGLSPSDPEQALLDIPQYATASPPTRDGMIDTADRDVVEQAFGRLYTACGDGVKQGRCDDNGQTCTAGSNGIFGDTDDNRALCASPGSATCLSLEECEIGDPWSDCSIACSEYCTCF